MAIKLNKSAYDHAVYLINNGLEVIRDANNWHEEKPTLDEEVRYLNSHTLEEYGLWFLGIDTDADPKDKSKYVHPYGDFNVIHQSALLMARQHADHEVKQAAARLIEMIETSTKR